MLLRVLLSIFVLALALAAELPAQERRYAGGLNEALREAPGLLRTSVSVLAAQGDSLWAGPFLNLTTDGGQSWQVTDAPDLQREGRNRLFSLDVMGDTLWVGLGYFASEEVPAAAGFLVSTDGGEQFAYRPPPLDAGTEESLTYGVSTLEVLPITAPEQSPPYDVHYDPATGTVWTAGWASGIRLSRDFGETWERAVLPPDSLDEIRPDESYDFRIAPEAEQSGFRNYLGFSVLVDETGTVWAGTVAGVNRSRPEDVFPEYDEARRWERFDYANTEGQLTGSWVTALAEQPRSEGRSTIWMATWGAGQAGERFGVSFTRDGGEHFEQTLLDERINDFAFRGDTVYAAGDGGLFVLDADGTLLQHQRTFATPEQPGYAAPAELRMLTVATTREALWVGTVDGLFRSTDAGQTWRVFRAEVPVNPEEPSDDIPQVEAYAYPNPFSPTASVSGLVRFVVEVQEPRDVTVQVFDFGMNRVRELTGSCQPGGNCEIAWDGTDASGRRIAGGTYFYRVQLGSRTARGKLVVVE